MQGMSGEQEGMRENICIYFRKGGLDHLLPKFEHIFVAVITFFPLSSVQILLLPACCLLCVLQDDIWNVSIGTFS